MIQRAKTFIKDGSLHYHSIIPVIEQGFIPVMVKKAAKEEIEKLSLI